jgi:Xaa-Pro dipeptidase
VRKAAELGDFALDEAHRLAAPGTSEAEILAAMQSIIIRNDGDDPANEFIIGSGDDALLCRYKTGRRVLDAQDQLTLEFSPVFSATTIPA